MRFLIFLISFSLVQAAPLFSRYKTKRKSLHTSSSGSETIERTISFSGFYYQYREPTVMNIKGPMASIGFGYFYGVDTFKFGVDGYLVTHLGLNTYHGGLVDVKTNKTTPYNTNSTDTYGALNLKIGANSINPKGSIYLYSGVGYRFLDNYIIDRPGLVASYRRLQGYFYLPTGANLEFVASPNMSILANGEYRIFVYGHNASLTKRIGFNKDLKFTQRSGVGARGEFGIRVKNPEQRTYSVFLTYDYWYLDDSSTDYALSHGKLNRYVEPKNHTNAYGIKVKIYY